MEHRPCGQSREADGLRYPAIQSEFVEEYPCIICSDAQSADVDIIARLKPDLLALSKALIAIQLLIRFREVLADVLLKAGRFLIGQADHRLSCFIEDSLDIDDVEPADHCAAEEYSVYVSAIKLFAELQDSVRCIVSANCSAGEGEAIYAKICTHDYACQTGDWQISDEALGDAEDAKGGLVEMNGH